MSHREIERFKAEVSRDTRLRKAVQELGSDVRALTKFANERGFRFGERDLTMEIEEASVETQALHADNPNNLARGLWWTIGR